MDRDDLEQHLARSECRITRGHELIDRQMRALADLRDAGTFDEVECAEQLLASFEATLTETVATRDFFRAELTELLSLASAAASTTLPPDEIRPAPTPSETEPLEHSVSFESSSRQENRDRALALSPVNPFATHGTHTRPPGSRRAWATQIVRQHRQN